MEQQRKGRSTSRSPSLSRRPSLKEKAGTSAGIVKSKKKSGTGVKKERWLLTRKTWRYMTDAVGNLLPEHHGSKTGSGTTSRRGSSALSNPIQLEHSWAGPSSSAAIGAGSPPRPASWAEPSGSSASASYEGKHGTSPPLRPEFEAIPLTQDELHRMGGTYDPRQSISQEGGASHSHVSYTSAPRQSLARSSICGGSGYIEDADVIPRLQKNFEHACNKEKKFLLWTRTRAKGLSGPALRDWKARKKGGAAGEEEETDHVPASVRRSRSGPSPGSKENLLEYYSPEEDMMDDDYDEYAADDQATVKDRRKSSAASSLMSSLVSGGLSFFRPLGHTLSSLASSAGSAAADSGIFSRTMPSGLIRYFRHAGIQTEPFPEEILIRLRLQSVQEEQQQQQQQQHIIHGRYGTDLPLEEQPSQLHHILIPIDKNVTGLTILTSGGQTTHHTLSGVGSPPRDTQAELDTKGDQGFGLKSAPTSPEAAAAPTDQTDKKSEESGYSSSISDTVMRYLRMARKNSKADNKETIDKFKTVNYDRSLRYIKSKNVTVEEALEHEKNKALLAQQKLEAAQNPPEASASAPTSPTTPSPTTSATTTKPVPPSTLAISGSKSAEPAKIKKVTKVKKSAKGSKKQTPVSSPPPTSPTEGAAEGTTTEGFPGPLSTSGSPTGAMPEELGSVPASTPATPTSPIGGGVGTPLSPTSPPASQADTPTTPGPSGGVVGVPAPPPPASIGVQAGDSLIRFLKNLNPGFLRKLSDFSSGSYGSSESPPVEVTSPRYSISTTVWSSNSDNELYQLQMLRGEYQIPPHVGGAVHPNIPAYIGGTGTGRSSLVDSSTSYSGADSGEFEEQIYGAAGAGVGSFGAAHHKKHSNTSSVSTSTSSTAATSYPYSSPLATTTSILLKKSSSSQQIRPIGGEGPRGGPSSSMGTLPLHYVSTSPGVQVRPRGGLGGGVSSLSVSSTPGTLTSFSAPRVNVSSSHSSSAPYIVTSKGSPSPSTTSTRSDYPQYSPRTTTITPTTTSSGSSHRSGFNFLSSFRSSSKRRTEKPAQSSSSSSLSSFLRRTSSGSTKQPTVAPPSVSFKDSLLGHVQGHGSSGGSKRDSGYSLGEGIYEGSSSGSALDSGSSLVMQKSKSSSSVLHQTHGSAGATAAAGSGGSTEKRGSTCSTGGGILSSQTARGLMSKSRIFKSRSKSQTRGSVGAGGSCTWTPQGKCKWSSVSGKQVTVEATTVLHLSETERTTLQKVALAKLQALNLGVDVKIPREKVGGSTKPKRRPYLLKKKALSTGFFDSGNKREETKEGGGSGLVFGIPLSQCVANDAQKRGVTGDTSTATSPGPDWEHSPNKRSQNGSRNSVSSVCDASIYNKGDNKMGSTESLVWGKRESCAALDSLSCSSGDLLGETVPPVSAAVPTIVSSCIKHLETYGLHTTGIFRVSTSLKRIRQLREDIDGGKDVQFGEEQNPHDVAALLKEFLRDLPEPLLCRDLYQAFLRTQKIRNRRLQLEAVQHLIQLLPVPNRDTLAALLKFFAKVVENSADTRTRSGELLMGNKMEAYSLATLIAPNILPCIPSEGSSTLDQTATQTKERRESIDVVNYMISNYKELFEVPAELLDEIYIHMMDTHPEIVEDLLRQKGGLGDDTGLDELETTSSVFEGSECGDPTECDEPTIVSIRKFQKREEILHKDGGKGGHPDSRRERNRCKEQTTEVDKGQSGAESDTSSTKSTSRWFRRGRSDHKSRTSSDSGSEKVRGKGKRESSLHESKRASSLDSVNLKDSNCPATTVIVAEAVVERQRSCSDQSLKVPENLSRRQSSPVLEGTGIITASLKIPVPVPHSIDDSDIPFIEDDNGDNVAPAPPPPRIAQFQTTTTTRPAQRSRAAAAAYAQDQVSSFTQSRNTPSSTHTSTPISSPIRQQYSEVSSPTFSPPNSPPYDDSNTFPYEELTLRFCLGPPVALPVSGTTASQQASPNTIMTANKPTATVIKSTTTTSLVQPGGGTGMAGKSQSKQEEPPESEHIEPSHTSTIDVRMLGKETKGAKIAGLIKSKTADFEKFAKDSQVGPSAIASNMRLRSQGNIQLKQQFLLRQHDKFQQPAPAKTSTGIVLGPEGLVNSGSRSLQRRKNLPPSSSSSAIVGGTPSQSSSSSAASVASSQPGTIEKEKQVVETMGGKSGMSKQQPAQIPVASATSRWKRSEIIASPHRGAPPQTGQQQQQQQRETFF